MPSDHLAYQFNYDAWYKQVAASQQRKAQLYTLRRGDGTIEEVGDGFDLLLRREESTRAGIVRAEDQWRLHVAGAQRLERDRLVAQRAARGNDPAVPTARNEEKDIARGPRRSPLVDATNTQVTLPTAAGLCKEWVAALWDRERRARSEVERVADAGWRMIDAQREHDEHRFVQQADHALAITLAARQRLIQIGSDEETARRRAESAEQQVRASLAVGLNALLSSVLAAEWRSSCRIAAANQAVSQCDADETQTRTQVEHAEEQFRDEIWRARSAFSNRHLTHIAASTAHFAAEIQAQLCSVQREESFLRKALVAAAESALSTTRDALLRSLAEIPVPPPPPPLPSELFEALLAEQAAGRTAIRHAASAWIANVHHNHRLVVEECARLERLRQEKVAQYHAAQVAQIVDAERARRRDVEAAFAQWCAHFRSQEGSEALTAPLRYKPRPRPPKGAIQPPRDALTLAHSIQIRGQEERLREALLQSEQQWLVHLRRQEEQERASLASNNDAKLSALASNELGVRSQIVQAEERWRAHIVTQLRMLRFPDPA